MDDVKEALKVYSDLLGDTKLSEFYRNKLFSLGLTEDDGYMIKFQVQLEIIGGRLKSNEIISRIEQLCTVLSKQRSNNSVQLTYGSDLLMFMYNQTNTNIECHECGTELFFIDEYCYNCGSKINHSINIIDLAHFVNSEDIKIGDLIKFNENGIEKITINEKRILPSLGSKSSLESNFNNKMTRVSIENKYFKVVLLNHINIHGSLRNFNYDNYKFSKKSSRKLIEELYNERMIIKSNRNKLEDLSLKLKIVLMHDYDVNDLSSNVNYYNITDKGLNFLNNNCEPLLYDKFIKNTVLEDLIAFDNFFNNNKDGHKKDTLINFVRLKRDTLLDDFSLDEFYLSYNIEAYIYETMNQFDKSFITLLKRFILTLNLNSRLERNPFDEKFINYLNNIIIENKMDVKQLKSYFNTGYMVLPRDKLLFSEDESFNLLLRCFNDEDIHHLNFELLKLVKENKSK